MKTIKTTQGAFDSLFDLGDESKKSHDGEFTEQVEAAEDFLEHHNKGEFKWVREQLIVRKDISKHSVEKHRELDKEVTMLYNKHMSDDIIKPKIDKLHLKQEITTLKETINNLEARQ